MAEQIARRAILELHYKGAAIGGHCLHAEYVDHGDGTMDELTARLQDRDKQWQAGWLPEKGDEISAVIHCFDWWEKGDHPTLTIKGMEVGEVVLDGPPDQVTVQAAAIKIKGTARTQRKTKAFENTSLRDIAGQVAGKANLGLSWDGNDPHYERVDQREESDMAFLKRLCREAGNAIKTIDDQLFVYEAKKWEMRPPVAVLTRGETWIKTYQFRSKTHDMYRGCVTTYTNPDTKETIKGEFFPASAPKTGEILRVRRMVKDQAHAIEVAKNTLRRKNRWEVEANFVLVGDVRRRATHVLKVQGFNKFNGNYITDKARHILDGNGGYETHLTLRRVVDY
jgi:phage protein D